MQLSRMHPMELLDVHFFLAEIQILLMFFKYKVILDELNSETYTASKMALKEAPESGLFQSIAKVYRLIRTIPPSLCKSVVKYSWSFIVKPPHPQSEIV